MISGEVENPAPGEEPHVRAFDVESGAELYLANVAIEDARANNSCGGAVLVRGRGKLVAQYTVFERNEAREGGETAELDAAVVPKEPAAPPPTAWVKKDMELEVAPLINS